MKMGALRSVLLVTLASGCVLGDDIAGEDVDTDESALKQGSLARPALAPPADPASVTETVAREVIVGAKPAIYVSGGSVKARPRAVLAVELGATGDETLHLLANVSLSRCNRDDVTGNGSAGSPCTALKKTWGSGGYPYQPRVRAYFRFSDGAGATKKVGASDTFVCTDAAHHCPLELAADVVPDPNLPRVELVVVADGGSDTKTGDLVELELDDAKNGIAKSSLHVFRVGRDAGAPGLVAKPAPSGSCALGKIEVKTSKSGSGSVAVLSQTVHVNPWTTHLEIAAFADVAEVKDGFFIEPLLNSQLVMTSPAHGRTELSPRGGLNCTGGKKCPLMRYGSLRVKPGYFGDEDITISYELGAVRTQKKHNGNTITGTRFVKPVRCGMNVHALRP